MATVQALAEALDETVGALSTLDFDTLKAVEERMKVLAESPLVADEVSIGFILAKKRVLELVLNHSESNLNVLRRLYGRNTSDLWQR